MDCRNVTSFFKKKGAQPASARSLFDFVIDSDLLEKDQEDRFKVRRLFYCDRIVHLIVLLDLVIVIHLAPNELPSCVGVVTACF